MHFSGIYANDTLNGIGFRVSLFVSGCGRAIKCKSCQNKKAWNFSYGEKYTQDTHNEIMEYLKPSYIKGISLLGGEVFDNLDGEELFDLVNDIKETYGDGKDIWCWTGYLYEDLIKQPRKREFISYLDILVDGDFQIDKKNLNNAWRGSENQRLINVQESLKQNKVVLYDC